MPSDEQWVAIPGYEGRYEVSTEGRVRSWIERKTGMRRAVPHTMKQSPAGRRRYPCVGLVGEYRGRQKTYCVHALVLTAFRGERPEGHEASHLNGVRADNRLANLAWETHQANMDRKRDHGTHAVGERVPTAKLSDAEALAIRHRYRAGERTQALATAFDVDRSVIRKIVVGKTWTHVGGPIGTRGNRPPRAVSHAGAAITKSLRDDHGLTWDEIARRLGVGRYAVREAYKRLVEADQGY